MQDSKYKKINWDNPIQKKEYMKEYMRKYQQRPEVKERRREYQREYQQRPEVKERLREYLRKYQQRPEVKEYQRKYQQRPEVKERRREYKREYMRKYQQRPEVKEYQRKYKQRQVLDLDTLIGILREKKSIRVDELPRCTQTLRDGEKIGVIEVEDGIVSLKESPMLSALNGFYDEWSEKIKPRKCN
jgi:hypothetical protein